MEINPKQVLRNKLADRTNLLNLICVQAENLQVWWKKYPNNLREHACLLGRLEYAVFKALIVSLILAINYKWHLISHSFQ